MKAKLTTLVAKVSGDLDADVVLYHGAIDSQCDRRLANQIEMFKQRPNVALFMTTGGGLPDVAYRIARYVQSKYQTFFLFVDSYCKSAGTLIAIGADEIILSDMGELGPLDIQIAKHDELGEYVSGLTPVKALAALRDETFKSFEEYLIGIIEKSYGQITANSAAMIATRLTTECFSAIYQQIDPMRFGEYERAMEIMYDYGIRLDKGNLKNGSLVRLISAYPSHGFVIDRREAGDLFKVIREPNPSEKELSDHVRGLVPIFREKGDLIPIEFLGPRSRILPSPPTGSPADVRRPRKSGIRRAKSASVPSRADRKDADGKSEPVALPQRQAPPGEESGLGGRRKSDRPQRDGKPTRG